MQQPQTNKQKTRRTGITLVVTATAVGRITLWICTGLLWGTGVNSPISQFVPGSSLQSWVPFAAILLGGSSITYLCAALASRYLKK